ncbi:alpha-L-fucosidase [Polaribacter reichenbachii]|uniref:alpha-L-fucosidase n=1 Tax=Polaribacter reichenbachii TaxID=996801 RepID=A0A1B8TUL8_9FLAO|nr:alpha-L-fucosidase [Polaribacter reichenbachii]APZ45479.1 alpha-L-fucosidase [Polaribacter reichenbachii]AUC19340.1 alpha-L-fucosidase [Polaribacter reichenbachii]OBY63506.1 alpha-L-fucosidase [Polaribacter reichenbachii]
MKLYKFLAVIILIVFISCKSNSKQPKTSDIKTTDVFQPNWESIKENYKDPEWFNNQKFGIFIHWGVYAVPAYGSEWYPRNMYMDKNRLSATLKVEHEGSTREFLHHKKTYGDQQKFGYKDFVPMFKAEKFSAVEWIDLFKKAGARYVVPVADHHDGFAMYKSNTTRWNSYDMGPKRDVLGELFKEGRKKGMIMGASSHYAFNWSFYNKETYFDTSNPAYADLYSKKGTDINEPVSEEFKQQWWTRTKDLIDNYQPDILWFDFMLDTPDFKEYRPQLAAYYYNKGIEWGKEVVLQDKNFSHEAFPEGTVIYDLERGKLPGIRKLPWQTDTSIGKNSWCHIADWQSKNTNQLIDDLVDIVSKNGNLLLNVGPKADGTIPEDQKEILLEMGNWLSINGDAIYDTKYWRTFGEGPTEVEKGHHSEGKNKAFTGQDIRFTQKDDKLYAIMMEWPENNSVLIKSINKNTDKVTNVTLLGSNEKIDWKQAKNGLKVKMPSKKPCDFAYVLQITL